MSARPAGDVNPGSLGCDWNVLTIKLQYKAASNRYASRCIYHLPPSVLAEDYTSVTDVFDVSLWFILLSLSRPVSYRRGRLV